MTFKSQSWLCALYFVIFEMSFWGFEAGKLLRATIRSLTDPESNFFSLDDGLSYYYTGWPDLLLPVLSIFVALWAFRMFIYTMLLLLRQVHEKVRRNNIGEKHEA